MTFGGYDLASKDSGSATCTAPGDTAPTSLVAGSVDYAGSTGGLQVDQQMYAKIGGSPAVFPSGGATGIDAPGSTGDGSPHIVVDSSEPAASVLSSSGFDLPSLFTRYQTLDTQMAALTDTVSLQDQNGATAWNSTERVERHGGATGRDPAATLISRVLPTPSRTARPMCCGISPRAAPSRWTAGASSRGPSTHRTPQSSTATARTWKAISPESN